MRPTLYSYRGHGHGRRRRCCCRREGRPCHYGGRRLAWDRQMMLAAARCLLRRVRAGSCAAAADWTVDATGTAADGRPGGAAAGEGHRAERGLGVESVRSYPAAAAKGAGWAPEPSRRGPCLRQAAGVSLLAALAAAGDGARKGAVGALVMPPGRCLSPDPHEAAGASAVVTLERPAGRCIPKRPFISLASPFVAGALTAVVWGPVHRHGGGSSSAIVYLPNACATAHAFGAHL